MSTNDFVALVNSFIFKPLKTLQITAFLVLCNYVDDLFNLNDVGSEVTPSALGWELVVENGIAGPPRRHNLLKPEGTEDIERLLLSSWKTAKSLVVESGGEITQDKLYAILAQEYIPNVKLDQTKLGFAIDYFSLVGIFFVFSDNKDEQGYNLLKFVDNGVSEPNLVPLCCNPMLLPAHLWQPARFYEEIAVLPAVGPRTY